MESSASRQDRRPDTARPNFLLLVGDRLGWRHSTYGAFNANGAPVEMLHQRTEERTAQLTQVAATADGGIAVAAAYGSLCTHDLTTFQQLHRLEGHEGPIWEIDLLDEAGLVASVSEDATARVWNITNGAVVAVFHGESPMKAVRITTVNGHVVVIAGEESGRVHTRRLRLD